MAQTQQSIDDLKVDVMASPSSKADVQVTYQLVSIDTAIKLLKTSFDGNPKELTEFIESVENAFSILKDEEHAVFSKICVSKYQGRCKNDIKLKFSTR